MSRLEFFKQNPAFRYDLLAHFLRRYFFRIFQRAQTLQQCNIYESIKQEFGESWGDNAVLIAQLITFVNTQQKRIAELEKQLKPKE